MNFIKKIKQSINFELDLIEKRPNIYQVVAPYYYEDGDMIEFYISLAENEKTLIFSDFGSTFMKLSYYLDNIGKDNTNTKVLKEIINENHMDINNGSIILKSSWENLSSSFIHFASTLCKISSLKYFNSCRHKSIFYEILNNFVESEFDKHYFQKDYTPINALPENKVDYLFKNNNKNIFLFGVKDDTKALKITNTCLEFKMHNLKYKSIVVYENFQQNLSDGVKARILRTTDKQFLDLEQFKAESKEYINLELAA